MEMRAAGREGPAGAPAGLAALERQVAWDLAAIEVPPRPWVPEARGPDGAPAEDVVIVGAGLSGLTIAFGLIRKGVRRLSVIDAAPEGAEGPWVTTARMETLRSPKWLSGPDLGVPSLTYRAWHEAQWGPGSYAALGRIGRETWMDYLAWFRRVLALPVENETALVDVAPAGDLLALTLDTPGGRVRRHCRKLVLATGIEGGGAPAVPAPVAEGLPRALWTHSAERLDLARLAGRRVAVIGAAASAFDWAAGALAAGAEAVTLVARDRAMPVTEILDWSNFPGFLDHFADLPAADRLRFTARMFAFRNPPTQEMYDRATADPRFAMRTGVRLSGAAMEGEAAVLSLSDGTRLAADHVLLGTGYAVDLARRPELAGLADRIATWGDAVPEVFADAHDPLRRYPYLGRAFELTEAAPGAAPFLRHVHVFNTAAVLSLGPICNGVTGLKAGVPRLVSGITRALFTEGLDVLYEGLDRFDTRHFEPHAEP